MQSNYRYWRLVLIIITGWLTVVWIGDIAPKFFTLPEPRIGCEKPLEWRVGQIDKRFDLSQVQFRQAVFAAENIWEYRLNKDILLYNPQAQFAIDIKYDHRQEMLNQSKVLQEDLQNYDASIQSLIQKHDQTLAKYEKDVRIYNQKMDTHNNDIQKYNRKVRKNSGENFSMSEYEKNKKKKQKLDRRTKLLQQELRKFSNQDKSLQNLRLAIENKNNTRNAQIEQFNSKFPQQTEPMIAGQYIPNRKIEVFVFDETAKLELILAHELGHALNINHLKEPSAIMYYSTQQATIQLSPADITAYQKTCPIRQLTARQTLAQYLIQTPTNQIKLPKLYTLTKKALLE